jgi:hypothetical protein
MSHPMKIDVISQDGETALKLTIGTQVKVLDGAGVEELVARLALMRASMRPPVAHEPLRTKQYVIEVDPCWLAQPNAAGDGAVLFLRHSGLGWTGFALPQESIEKLSGEFADYIAAPVAPNGTAH